MNGSVFEKKNKGMKINALKPEVEEE